MITEVEIVAPEQAQLVAVIQQNNLPAPVAASLRSSFAPLFASAQSILEKSRGISVTDASQKLEIKLARECRLALRAVRVEGDKIRKTLKDQSLREGRAIDGFQNILLHLTETEEKRLDDQEKFAERQEAARKSQLKADREKVAAEIGINPMLYQLGEMTEETFAQLVEGTKLARAAAAEKARKDEADRIAREAAEQAERERIREENARLKREADEKEAAMKVERERVAAQEREAAEERDRQNRLHAEELDRQRVAAQREKEAQREAAAATLKAEQDRLNAIAAEQAALAKRVADEFARTQREAAAAAEAELKAQREQARKEQLRLQALAAAALNAEKEKTDAAWRAADAAKKAEHDRIAAEQAAERKAAAAPDKEKLLYIADDLRTGLVVPPMTTDAGKDLVIELLPKITRIAEWLETEAKKL